MATTRKDGAPAKERPSRPSPTLATMQNPRPRTTTKPSSPATSPSEKDAVVPTSVKKPTANYLKPTFSSSPEAARQVMAQKAGTTRASQKSLSTKKGLDAKPLPQRNSSSNPPRVQTKPVLSSRSSFSERTSKGKAAQLPRRADSPPRRKPSARVKGKCSVTSATSSIASTTSSPKAMTEETMSNEDREAALDILDLDVEEHVLVEIPQMEDKVALPEELIHVESDVAEELTAFVEHEQVLDPVVPEVETGNHEQHHSEVDDSDEVKKEEVVAVEEEYHEEKLPTVDVVGEEEEDEEKPGEAEENTMVAASGGADVEGEVEVKLEPEEGEKEGGDLDGGGEKAELTVGSVEEEAAEPAKQKRKEAAQQQQRQQEGKKGVAPAYNDVIEETANKLVEKRKSKVKALVGAFETVIVLDSGGQAQ